MRGKVSEAKLLKHYLRISGQTLLFEKKNHNPQVKKPFFFNIYKLLVFSDKNYLEILLVLSNATWIPGKSLQFGF